MAFYVGQKVECYCAPPTSPSGRETLVKNGAIYTVAGYEVSDLVVLVEQPGRSTGGRLDPTMGFPDRFFRPVVERKTDISVFEKLLNPSHEEVSA